MIGDEDIAGRESAEGTAELRAVIADAFVKHDKAAAVRAAVEAVSSGRIGIAELYRVVLTPLLVETGAAWQSGRTAVWEEHLASAAVRTIVEILYPGVLKAKAAARPAKRGILLACPPEEAHDLGLRMVADRFDMAGWTTYYLGSDTPVEEIVDAAGRLNVDAVALSSSTHFHRLAVRHAVDGLEAALPGIQIWVGGAAFAGAVTGWLPRELVDLDELLGDGFDPEGAAPAGRCGIARDAIPVGEDGETGEPVPDTGIEEG